MLMEMKISRNWLSRTRRCFTRQTSKWGLIKERTEKPSRLHTGVVLSATSPAVTTFCLPAWRRLTWWWRSSQLTRNLAAGCYSFYPNFSTQSLTCSLGRYSERRPPPLSKLSIAGWRPNWRKIGPSWRCKLLPCLVSLQHRQPAGRYGCSCSSEAPKNRRQPRQVKGRDLNWKLQTVEGPARTTWLEVTTLAPTGLPPSSCWLSRPGQRLKLLSDKELVPSSAEKQTRERKYNKMLQIVKSPYIYCKFSSQIIDFCKVSYIIYLGNVTTIKKEQRNNKVISQFIRSFYKLEIWK